MTLRHSQPLMPDLSQRQLIPSAFMESVTDISVGIYLHSDTIKLIVGNDKFPKQLEFA